jgi:O-acetyl-ADP-ribose deacetylase (regulator of RNase III)
MPITTKHGSIFDSRAKVLVCPVNCVGVMGKGLALEFKRRFPDAFHSYLIDVQTGITKPGESRYHRMPQEERNLMLCATKDHWRNPSRIEWVEGCLRDIRAYWWQSKFPSIAIPQLGCGCGGLDWADVEPLYEKHLGGLDCDVEVWIYE